MATAASSRFPFVATAVLLALALPDAAVAQAVTIISNSSHARDCYNAATNASLKLPVSKDDLESCNYALANELLTRADTARTHINRGIVKIGLDLFQEALADYNTALELQPGMPEAYISRGNLWYLAGKFQRAVDEYTQALQSDFKRPQIAYYNRGLTREKLGDNAAAAADYREALKLDPAFAVAQERLQRLADKPAP